MQFVEMVKKLEFILSTLEPKHRPHDVLSFSKRLKKKSIDRLFGI